MIPLPPNYHAVVGTADSGDAVKRAVRDRLGHATPELDRVLSRIIEHDYPAPLWQIDLEVHDVSEVDRELDVVAHFYAKEYEEITSGLPLTDAQVLKGPPVLTTELLESCGVDPDDEQSDWAFYAAEIEVIGWIAERWRAVNQGRFKHRATVAAHDADYRFDLERWEWSDSL